jgi:hypothetical protein
MQNQESMFEKSEPTPVRPINIDPREQAQRDESPPVEGNEEEQYKGYSEGYNGQTYGEPWQAEGEKIQPRQQNRGRKRGGIKPLVIALLIIALVVGWGGMSSGRFVEGGRSMPAQVFTVNDAPTLVLNNGSGEVHVHVGNVRNIVVSASTHGFGMMQDNDGQMVRTEQDGNTITVSPAGRSGMFGRPVDLDITVPSATNLELRTSSGDINVEGVQGQMTLASDSGEIKGDNLTGAFNISTNSGDVKLEDSTLRGENNFRSDSGKIEFQGSLDPQGSYQFQTNSGDVELKLPAASSFHLTHTSNNGEFENEFPQAENKDALGPQLNIVTNSGDISIKSQGD